MDLIKIGAYIAGKRKALNLTQRQLAEKLGMSDKSVSKWERGVCLPDVSVYSELCAILGISLNEFLAGEDIGQAELEQKSEDNLIQVTADGQRRQARLRRIIAALLIAVLIAAVAAAVILYRANRPRNDIAPIDRSSAEMKTAELLSGVDGAFLFRYRTSDEFRTLTVFVSKYQGGELNSKENLTTSYESVGSPSGGMIVIVPDFEHFTVKLILADDRSKLSTSIPILEDVEGREYYGRTASPLDAETDIRYGEEQGLVALIYDQDMLRVLNLSEFESGHFPAENDFVYYFSYQFDK